MLLIKRAFQNLYEHFSKTYLEIPEHKKDKALFKFIVVSNAISLFFIVKYTDHIEKYRVHPT